MVVGGWGEKSGRKWVEEEGRRAGKGGKEPILDRKFKRTYVKKWYLRTKRSQPLEGRVRCRGALWA